jgi:hypothetical protein
MINTHMFNDLDLKFGSVSAKLIYIIIDTDKKGQVNPAKL